MTPTTSLRAFLASVWSGRTGSSLIELALIAPMFLLLIAAAVDFGCAYIESIDLASAAQAGALYGASNPTDVSGMISASQKDGTSLSGMSTTACYGCECPDGSSASASCTTIPICSQNYVNYVDVVTTAPFHPFMALPGLPAAGTFRGESRMRSGGD